MQCFDCAVESSRETAACATCHTCGAGVCLDHAVAGYAQEEHRSLGNPAAHRVPGRLLFCKVCAPSYLGNVAAGERLVMAG